tara:strand:+ start:6034 stop:6240 length:207 start_codon:yes stop_codon:yes gene_type:complete
MNSNDLKKIAIGSSINEETYDYCLNCQTETPISELNLVNGSCSVCTTNRFKITDEQMRELIELDVGFK